MKLLWSFLGALFLGLMMPLAWATSLPELCHKDNCVSVEIVSKQADMEQGLMYRTHLDQNKGMLFVFTVDDYHQFWMKNMHFSLDLLWISQDKRIVSIDHDVPACSTDPCPVYSPFAKARYVLEINSGYATAHHWQVNDGLEFK